MFRASHETTASTSPLRRGRIPGGHHEDATHEVDVEEPIEVGDLLDDPRTDAEALCLCALLWSPADTASDVSDLLWSTDFERGVYGELFEVITAQVRSGAPHDPGSIASRLTGYINGANIPVGGGITGTI